MPASKNLPATTVDFERNKKAQRKSVGMRMPDDRVCRAVLEAFGGCLLSHSVHVPEHLDAETGGCALLRGRGRWGDGFGVRG